MGPEEYTDRDVFVTLARLEAKVDVAIARQGAQIEAHDADIDDHEARIRALENQPHIKPFTLWTALIGGITAFVALSPFLQHITALLGG